MEWCRIALKCHSLEMRFAFEEQHRHSLLPLWVIAEVLRHLAVLALNAVFCARVSVFLPVGCGAGCG